MSGAKYLHMIITITNEIQIINPCICFIICLKVHRFTSIMLVICLYAFQTYSYYVNIV